MQGGSAEVWGRGRKPGPPTTHSPTLEACRVGDGSLGALLGHPQAGSGLGAWKGGLGVRVGKGRHPRWKDQGGEEVSGLLPGTKRLEEPQLSPSEPRPGGARWSGGSTGGGVRPVPKEPRLCPWPSPSLPFPMDTLGVTMPRAWRPRGRQAGCTPGTPRTTLLPHPGAFRGRLRTGWRETLSPSALGCPVTGLPLGSRELPGLGERRVGGSGGPGGWWISIIHHRSSMPGSASRLQGPRRPHGGSAGLCFRPSCSPSAAPLHPRRLGTGCQSPPRPFPHPLSTPRLCKNALGSQESWGERQVFKMQPRDQQI